MPAAGISGFQRALLASSILLLVAAAIATRTSNAQGELIEGVQDESPELARV